MKGGGTTHSNVSYFDIIYLSRLYRECFRLVLWEKTCAFAWCSIFATSLTPSEIWLPCLLRWRYVADFPEVSNDDRKNVCAYVVSINCVVLPATTTTRYGGVGERWGTPSVRDEHSQVKWQNEHSQITESILVPSIIQGNGTLPFGVIYWTHTCPQHLSGLWDSHFGVIYWTHTCSVYHLASSSVYCVTVGIPVVWATFHNLDTF